MRHQFTLEYWKDGDWFVGRLLETPDVFSQGETLEELHKNIQYAYNLMYFYRSTVPADVQRQPVVLEVPSNGT